MEKVKKKVKTSFKALKGKKMVEDLIQIGF